MGQIIVTPSLDGYVQHDDLVGALSWHELVISAGSAHVDDNPSTTIGMMWARVAPNTNKWRRCSRGILVFNTSTLPDVCTITGATLQMYGWAKFDGLSVTPDICLYAATPASELALANSDYTTLGTTPFSDAITYAAFNDAGYNTFTLTVAGLAAISKTGNTVIGARNANYDVADELDPDNHDPAWHSNNDSFFTLYTRLEAGKEPILTVNYTDPSPPGVSSQGSYFARQEQWRG